MHLITKLVYPKPFKLVVCYNTPKPLEFEEELATYHGRVFQLFLQHFEPPWAIPAKLVAPCEAEEIEVRP